MTSTASPRYSPTAIRYLYYTDIEREFQTVVTTALDAPARTVTVVPKVEQVIYSTAPGEPYRNKVSLIDVL